MALYDPPPTPFFLACGRFVRPCRRCLWPGRSGFRSAWLAFSDAAEDFLYPQVQMRQRYPSDMEHNPFLRMAGIGNNKGQGKGDERAWDFAR